MRAPNNTRLTLPSNGKVLMLFRWYIILNATVTLTRFLQGSVYVASTSVLGKAYNPL